ncbi:hypothetical protein [Rufibacter roseus]|uniref:S1 motif domain-containing protein n=1 Tax=Rufibacter roseus TaxID=1567108 RepID=A0ABW2DMT9_9BACT|nr:hypothetical protein [Rufibacter roseus]
MNKRYRILWIDDKIEEFDDFVILADNNCIDLEGYKSFEEGFNVLENDLIKYDGVLLDALFFAKKDQVRGEEDVEGLVKAVSRLNELKSQKLMPWFILSGQDSFTKEQNGILKAYNKRCFDKKNGDDLEALLELIKVEANGVEDTKIRHMFPRAFDACEALGAEAQKFLLQILKSTQTPATPFDDKLYFTQIRIILEQLFREANKQGLLHDKCLEGGKVNLSESCLFLAGKDTKHLGIKCGKAHLPKIIADNAWAIVSITGAASHTEGENTPEGRASIAEYRKYVDTPYLLYSLTFQLIDILIWFKSYFIDNPDKEKNQVFWIPTSLPLNNGEWVNGKVVKIAENGYGTFQPSNGSKTLSIIPPKVKEFNLKEQQEIKVTTKQDGTGTKTLIENIKIETPSN